MLNKVAYCKEKEQEDATEDRWSIDGENKERGAEKEERKKIRRSSAS